MIDIVQSVQLSLPQKTKLPLPHFTDVTLGAHTLAAHENKILTIEYLAPNLSSVRTIIDTMLLYNNSFVEKPTGGFVNIPTRLSVTLATDSPIRWSVSYEYPTEIEDYLNSESDFFGVLEAPLQFTSDGIFSCTVQLEMEAPRFGMIGELVGLKFSPVRYSIRVASFMETDPAEYVRSIFPFAPNENLSTQTVSESETVDGVPILDYNLGGIL